jgi:hypothetical protein
MHERIGINNTEDTRCIGWERGDELVAGCLFNNWNETLMVALRESFYLIRRNRTRPRERHRHGSAHAFFARVSALRCHVQLGDPTILVGS